MIGLLVLGVVSGGAAIGTALGLGIQKLILSGDKDEKYDDDDDDD